MGVADQRTMRAMGCPLDYVTGHSKMRRAFRDQAFNIAE